jgi:uncharacterized protein (TIGR02996 family)
MRPYELTLFGENYGPYVMPIGDHMEDPEARMRPILTKPYREGEGEGTEYYWVEPDSDGDFATVRWRPETAEAREEAERFYNEAHGLDRYGTLDPDRQPPFPARSVEETQLIRAAREDPENEQLYLEYAEWIAQKGDPYADFIKLTIQLESQEHDDKRYERLDKRRDSLLRKYGAQWIRGLTDLGLFPDINWDDEEDEEDEDEDELDEQHEDEDHDEEDERGEDEEDEDDDDDDDDDDLDEEKEFYPNWWFNDKGVIDSLEIPAGTFVFKKHPARLFAAAPFLTQLTVKDPDITVGDLAVLPQMGQIETLSATVGRGDVIAFHRFAESPHFGRLEWLTLTGGAIGAEGMRALATAAWLANLQGLNLSSNPLGDEGAEALAGSAHLTSLADLALDNNGLTDRGLIALCRSPYLEKLDRLELQKNAFSAEGLRALASAAFAEVLGELGLQECGLDERALEALAAADLSVLRSLELSRQALGDGAIRALVAAPFFHSLGELYLNGCALGNGAAEAIAGAGPIDLYELRLDDNRIGAEGVAALVGSDAAAQLQELSLARNPLGTEGVVALGQAELPALERLNLCGIKLGKEAIVALGRAPWRKRIESLDVSADCMSPRALEVLRERFGEDNVFADGE